MYLARTALIGDTFQIELEFRNVGFWGEGKTGVPGEKPLGARTRTNNKLNPHMTPRPGIEPGPHWWEASALTTAPSLLPIHLCFLSLFRANEPSTVYLLTLQDFQRFSFQNYYWNSNTVQVKPVSQAWNTFATFENERHIIIHAKHG